MSKVIRLSVVQLRRLVTEAVGMRPSKRPTPPPVEYAPFNEASPLTAAQARSKFPEAVRSLSSFLRDDYDDTETKPMRDGMFETRPADDVTITSAWGDDHGAGPEVLVYVDDNYTLAFNGQRWDSIS